MTKYQITRFVPEGMAGRTETRVVAINEGDPVPDGASAQSDDTPLSDWGPVNGHWTGPSPAFQTIKFPQSQIPSVAPAVIAVLDTAKETLQ